MEKNQNKSVGNILNFQENRSEIAFITSYGNVKIEIFREHVFKVHISKEKIFSHFSYIVIGEKQQVDYQINEFKDHFNIATSELQLDISKSPLRLTFKDKSGEVINKDDPAFGTSWIGDQVTTYKTLQPGERFIGLGEKTGNLDRRGHGYVNWNTDDLQFSTTSDPLYGSYPFYIGIHRKAYGIYLDNSYRSVFNFGASNDRFSYFSADDGEMVYYFISHKNIEEIIKTFTEITGRMPLPPKWSLGYHQSRLSYFPDNQVISIAKTFREKNIAADVIYLDIDYMHDYKLFTWHPERFPEPEKMIEKLKSMGFRVVLILDPGVKIEEGYSVYEEGKEKDVFLKYPDHSYYTAKVWPGWCHFPDFTNPVARQWWMKKLKIYVDSGATGFWNDMNEISSMGECMPDIIQFNMDGNKSTSREGRNIYGLLMSKSTYEGARSFLNERPFILNRAGFCGVQRYSAIWTGDNKANDEHMLLDIRMINSLGMTGVPFAGSDVGGFMGETSKKLFARWITLGAFAPFFRVHSIDDKKSSEPWSYTIEIEDIARNYINLRYRLLPYLYSVFYEAAKTGLPIARSLVLKYQSDENIYNEKYQNQFLFGPFILIAPCKSEADFTDVYLPEGSWYDFFSDKELLGPEKVITRSPVHKLPIYIKSGAIIPVQSVIQHSADKHDGILEIHIYYSNEDTAFEYYEDDGISFDYEDDFYFKRMIRFTASEKKIILNKKEGKLFSSFKSLKFILHNFRAVNQVVINKKPVNVQQENYEFFDFLNKNNTFDEDSENKDFMVDVQVFEHIHLDENIVIEY